MSDFIIKTKKIILLIGDVIFLYLALWLTLILRYGSDSLSGNWDRHLKPFSLVFIVWLIVFFINDFYDLKISYNASNLANTIIKLFAVNLFIAVAMFYFFTPFLDSIRPQRVLIIQVAASLILLFGWRTIFYNFIKSTAITNKVLIVGDSPLAKLLAAEIQKRPQLGYSAEIIPTLPDNLEVYCRKNNIDILAGEDEFKNNQEVIKKIFGCFALGITVCNISGLYEQVTNKIPIENIEHGWFLENLSEHSKKNYEIIKRFFDIILASLGLIATSPFLPFIALLIKFDGSGPVLFKQVRTGKNGQPFLAVKFRSMIVGAEKNGPQWAIKDDPRITRFGRLMRKTRIDEIPQLLNVLRGEMSFVGPRPERPEFIEILEKEIPFYRERLLVKPGLTGWAQLNGPSYGGSKEETLEKIKYDLYYLKNRSLFLDTSIMLKTIKVVLGGKGQ